MNIVILGPNGQLGGDICDVLGEQDEGVIKIGRDVVDVTNTELLNKILDEQYFDVLINCTSFHKTDEVEEHAQEAIAVNATAVEAMARAAARKNAQFIHFSTDYVFGGDKQRTIPLIEKDRPAPVNVYGLSKLFGEVLASMATNNLVIFRVASLFGVRGASGKGGNFVETMIRVGREKGEMRVVNDQLMSPTATRTIAECVQVFLKKNGGPGIYHCVNSGGATSWYEFAKQVILRVGIDASVKPCTSKEYPTPAKRPGYSALSNKKLENLVGPIRPWQDALDDYLLAKGYRSDG